jgi:hypothetical protein
MALMRMAVAFFSDIPNFFCNSKLLLLLLPCRFCNSHCPVKVTYFEWTDIIVDSIDAVGKGIVFEFCIISNAANCCPDIIFNCLAILDRLAQASFSIGVLCFDREGKLLNQRHGIVHQCLLIFSYIIDDNMHRIFVGYSWSKERTSSSHFSRCWNSWMSHCGASLMVVV